MEQLPERHIECSECKKPIVTCYTEVIGKTVYRLGMCADCPVLRRRLYSGSKEEAHSLEAKVAGLCCGGCETTADEVKMGLPLGCSLCYEVFEDLLIDELRLSEHLPQKHLEAKMNSLLHVGRSPGQVTESTEAQKLLSLHQALHESLSREDYEQAAWLRDQIKALTEEKRDGKQEST
ncbi:MAG: UvrB/UvrC motif-containing protein [Verrucomicrobia bacterium]|nr:UvrB/UvrC motif-containing protein [Verrucomicrobiota bacterium]